MARSLGIVSCILVLGVAAACSKSGEKATEKGEGETTTSSAKEPPREALVETFPAGSIAWTIGDDGKLRADVRDRDGAAAGKSASGTIDWTADGAPRGAKLVYDESAKALTAAGPPLRADITPIKYAISTAGETLTGTLHVPVGGTAALVADAKAAEKEKPIGSDASGPNGGVVQVLGDERVEIVGDEDSDEVRVYVLDPNGKVVPVGDRKVTIAVTGDTSDVVVLTPSGDGLSLVGAWKVKTDPSRITIVVRRPAGVHVAIVGWRPGVKLVVAGGPKWKVKVKGHGSQGRGPAKLDVRPSGGDKHDDDHGHGKGGGKGKGR